MSSTNIIKPASDKRDYEYFSLPNGFNAVVVSDPDIQSGLNTKAAASLSVRVGSFSDPEDGKGLAHLLEHLVCKEEVYGVFLAALGSDHRNADTSEECTTYYFELNQSFLKEGLEKFSRLFVSPVFDLDEIEREIKAVDAEFAMASKKDSERLCQLQSSTATASHPYNYFGVGNRRSLTQCEDMQTKPMQFFRKNYQAQRMTLAVLGGEPVEVLKEWVTCYFKHIPAGESVCPTFQTDVRPWPAGRMYRLESLKNKHKLVLSWPMPCLDQEYLKRPKEYILYLLANECHGSLAKSLKEKGWVSKFAAKFKTATTAGELVTICIKLTSLGLDKVYDIITYFYEYMRMIRKKKPQKWIFKELQASMTSGFRFLEGKSVGEYVQKISESMHIFPAKHVLYHDFVCELWDPELIHRLTELIHPENMRVDLVTLHFDPDAEGVITEPWFEALYMVQDIPQKVLRRWSKPKRNRTFSLPSPNGFIARDLSIRESSDVQPVPCILTQDSLVTVWYKFDDTFARPVSSVYLLIKYFEKGCVRSTVLADLFILLLDDALQEIKWMAGMAGSNIKILLSDSGLQILVHGYTEKVGVLVESTLQFLPKFQDVKDNEYFQSLVDRLAENYENGDATEKGIATILVSISAEHFNSFVSRVLHQAKVEALCHGNMSKEEAYAIVGALRTTFGNKETSLDLANHEIDDKKTSRELASHKVKSSFHDDHACRNIPNPNEFDENSSTITSFFIEPTFRENAICQLFVKIVAPHFFNKLRLEEQLGYDVRLTTFEQGLRFSIVSNLHNPNYLHERIEAFLEGIQAVLEGMREHEFDCYKNCLMVAQSQRAASLREEANNYWRYILNGSHFFSERQVIAMRLQELGKQDVMSWFQDCIKAGGGRRRKRCEHVWASFYKHFINFN